MLTKAYIIQLPKQGNNIYKVRVPFLEDNTGTPMFFDALLCNQPGQYNGY